MIKTWKNLRLTWVEAQSKAWLLPRVFLLSLEGCKATLGFVRCRRLLFVSHRVNSICSFPNTREMVTSGQSKCIFNLSYYLKPARKTRLSFHVFIWNVCWRHLWSCWVRLKFLSNADGEIWLTTQKKSINWCIIRTVLALLLTMPVI